MPLSSPLQRRLSDSISGAMERRANRQPVWRGPEEDGVTQSLLGRFLSDRERFRLLVVEGLKEKDRFNHRLEYGSLWHHCEEATAAKKPWLPALQTYAKQLIDKYRESANDIDKWYKVAKVQYPIYLKWWATHPDVKSRNPIYQETEFSVPYRLPSGRTVRLRGKWDAVDLIREAPVGIYIQENKTKGDVREEQIKSQITYDLQSMTYLTAVVNWAEITTKSWPVRGFRYNVVRRPLSGREFNIIQLKGRGKEKKGAETDEQFYQRLGKIIEENAAKFFMRWRVEVSRDELLEFQRQSLNPILEQLCDWWEWIAVDPFNPWRRSETEAANGIGNVHFRLPYGVWNPTLEGRESEYDDYLRTGNARYLDKVDDLFPELAV